MVSFDAWVGPNGDVRFRALTHQRHTTVSQILRIGTGGFGDADGMWYTIQFKHGSARVFTNPSGDGLVARIRELRHTP